MLTHFNLIFALNASLKTQKQNDFKRLTCMTPKQKLDCLSSMHILIAIWNEGHFLSLPIYICTNFTTKSQQFTYFLILSPRIELAD